MYNFYILETISKFPELSQKGIAEKCNISAGKVNYTINHLLERGLLEVIKSGRKFQYLLTDSGKEYLKNQLGNLQANKVSIHNIKHKEVKNAVILAAGSKSDFNVPACLVPVSEITLLERTVNILFKNGIEKIVIVTGYKSSEFEGQPFITSNPNIHLIHNPEYLWTGSMSSLAMASELVDDDFLLFEDDILIEENAIVQLMDHHERDCILVTKESGSGDEGYIEIKNGYLYKISKDIHQLNRIDGEMIGVTKLSHEVYKEMLKDFQDNKNPYVNYEYLLLDVSRKINIGYLKISDLIWAEIDNNIQLKTVVDKTYPMLVRKEELFQELELRQSIADALNIDVTTITEVKPFGGMTNKNYKAAIAGEEYVVRVSGVGTDKMINRIEEKMNAEQASKLGINPEQLYFNEKTGLKIVRFIENAETLNPKTAKRVDNIHSVVKILQQLHQSDIEMMNEFDTFQKLSHYELLAIEAGADFFEDYETVRNDVFRLKRFYDQLNVEMTPCHNDTVPENFVKSSEEKLYLIDWEYAGKNDPLWDLAAFSLECGFSEAEEELLLNKYRNGQETIEDRQRILIAKIYQDFLWSVWTVLKEACGDDFGPYGLNRYNRAKENINKFDALFTEVEAVES
ncbi:MULTISPECIES: phosphocholine cytidylyltransferase/choline kinase family protein [unclassified Bacillus (in: firmicutes)]|uniref:phosphocholine cytidylyltransferase/choline kinase family protein n=1 Tax=unclassified Bacillus (in: firmicutes) TaxID=185979 RepID=UPI0008F329E6|nr:MULTISPECIES: phosphocholine cytidylyltransferase/choline kinase family protein [unclassified Bacillus (in: firmicutes)]SFB25456.1 Thiamine kinase [Bacillus sp. UNCCL13]SFQ91752.1 Thiamine kinase [Bacillus sp. cl95]